MSVTRIEDLIAWQKAMELAKEIYRLTSQGKFSKDWGLRDQIRKAAVSVFSNIAEGFGRYSVPEFKRFLSIANGSVFEVKAQCMFAKKLGYLTKEDATRVVEVCEEVSRLVKALRAKTKVL